VFVNLLTVVKIGQVAPIPELVPAGTAANFDAVCYGSHLENKVLNNFELEPRATSIGEA